MYYLWCPEHIIGLLERMKERRAMTLLETGQPELKALYLHQIIERNISSLQGASSEEREYMTKLVVRTIHRTELTDYKGKGGT
jgi:hypothetical protein